MPEREKKEESQCYQDCGDFKRIAMCNKKLALQVFRDQEYTRKTDSRCLAREEAKISMLPEFWCTLRKLRLATKQSPLRKSARENSLCPFLEQ